MERIKKQLPILVFFIMLILAFSPMSLAVTYSFEAENLARTQGGATTQIDTETGFSNGQAVKLNGDGVGDYVEFTVPNLAAGTYNIKLTYKTFNSRGIVQLSIDGTNLGVPLNQYAVNPAYGAEASFGVFTFGTTGNKLFRFTVTGKSSGSSSYTASFDKITVETPPLYLDTNQPLEARVADLVSRLTLDEKGSQMYKYAPAIPRLAIPYNNAGWNQVLHGVATTRATSMFPIPPAMSATWDPVLIKNVASAISDELWACKKLDGKGLICRSPVIDMTRDPLWGRICETWGEDPTLTGKMAIAFINGLQGDDPRYLKAAATLKHMGCYDNEENRLSTFNAVVSERLFHEYFTRNFRSCIIDGKAQSVMVSYNNLNGTPVHVNPVVMKDTLKNLWGFDGFVVSDTGGVNYLVSQKHWYGTYEEAVAAAVKAGVDFSDEEYRDNLANAVRNGRLTEQDLNDALTRIFRVRFRLGEFDPPALNPYNSIPTTEICHPDHRALSLQAARESIVLLGNQNNFLPLNKNNITKIAVIGPHANIFTKGTPNYDGNALNPVTPLAGIQNKVNTGTQVLYSQGCDFTSTSGQDAAITAAANTAAGADLAVVYVGTNSSVEAEGKDRTSINLPGMQLQLVQAVYQANPNTVVVLMNAGPLSAPWIKDNVKALVEAFFAGEEGGNAIADVLFGNVNPSGRLPYTVYESLSQLPNKDDYDITKGYTYMYFGGTTQFSFGHGLSYTTFQYSNLLVTPGQVPTNGQVTVSVDVRNSGTRSGDEVVQLYTHQRSSSVSPVPVKELKEFQRISLNAGETKTVTFTLKAADLFRYSEASHGFIVEAGVYDVMVGSSAADIRLQSTVTLTASGPTATPIPTPTPTPGVSYELENVGYTASGATTQVDNEAGFSNGQSVKLNATGANQYIEFTVNLTQTGTFHVKLRYKTFSTRGIYRLRIDGTDLGPTLDMYAASGSYNNEFDFGTRTFNTTGNKVFRFTVTGKNASSTGYTGHFDKLTLTP